MSFSQGAPTQPLSLVASNVFLTGSSTAGNAFTVQQLGSGNVFTAVTSTGTTGLIVSGGGNVGIGTTNPAYQIDTQGAAGLRLYFTSASTYGSGGAQIAWQDAYTFSRITTNNDNTTYLQFGAAPSSDSRSNVYIGSMYGVTPFIYCKGSNGYVGIGTNGPGYPLDVNGKIRSSQLAMVGFTNIVNRRPIWGTGSRAQGLYVTIPYSTSLSSQLLFYTYGPFQYAVPAVATGATRYYRIYAVYNDNATVQGTMYLQANFNGGGSVTFPLAFTYGGASTIWNRDYYTATIADPANVNHCTWYLYATPSTLGVGTGSFLINFDYIELQAIDQY